MPPIPLPWLIGGGVGVAGLALGGVLGILAKSQYDNAEGESGAARHNDSVSAVS